MQMIRPRTLETFRKPVLTDETSVSQPEGGKGCPALIELSVPRERKTSRTTFLLSDDTERAGRPGLSSLLEPNYLAARAARLRRTLPYSDLI